MYEAGAQYVCVLVCVCGTVRDRECECRMMKGEEAWRLATRVRELEKRGEELDANDPLKGWRAKFLIPTARVTSGVGGVDEANETTNATAAAAAAAARKPCIYLCGNSLGAQPASTRSAVLDDLTGWQELGVEGHFTAPHSWVDIEDTTTAMGARIVGALDSEVAHMNSLTVNLHLMMCAFYRPDVASGRTKVLIEHKAFPSDEYAVASQVEHHGLCVDEHVIRMKAREGEHCLRAEDVAALLDEHGHEIAVVLFAGVQYYTGQLFDIAEITTRARAAGCVVGWDLAHAVGNVPLSLHEWGPDFAVWCTYKYLNAGPGSIGGCFVHERHHRKPGDPDYVRRLSGWWGHDRSIRFQMGEEFVPQPGAAGFQLSNPPTLPMRQLAEALKVHDAAGMLAIRAKSKLMTAYLEQLIDAILGDEVTIITPKDPARRGAQLSLVFTRKPSPLKFVHDRIRDRDMVIVDFREPDVIRVAAAPLYNTFAEIFAFVAAVRSALDAYDDANM